MKIDVNPACHKIEAYGLNIPGDSCLSVIVNAIKGVRTITIARGEKVFLGRTDQDGTYSCPVRILGRCNFIAPCDPEPKVTVVDADINRFSIQK